VALAVFVVAQFTCILLGSRDANSSAPLDHAPRLVWEYAIMTGAIGNYRFFSPNIGDQNTASVTLYRDKQQLGRVLLGSGRSEASLRQSTFMLFLANVQMPQLESRVLAAYELGRMRKANRAKVILNDHVIPSMERFRAGDRPYDKAYYEATFQK
jgi:hypothetical protein